MNSAIEARALAGARRDSGGRWQAARMKAIRRLIAWFRHERRIRRAIDEAMRVDEHRLSDLGRASGNIERAAR